MILEGKMDPSDVVAAALATTIPYSELETPRNNRRQETGDYHLAALVGADHIDVQVRRVLGSDRQGIVVYDEAAVGDGAAVVVHRGGGGFRSPLPARRWSPEHHLRIPESEAQSPRILSDLHRPSSLVLLPLSSCDFEEGKAECPLGLDFKFVMDSQ